VGCVAPCAQMTKLHSKRVALLKFTKLSGRHGSASSEQISGFLTLEHFEAPAVFTKCPVNCGFMMNLTPRDQQQRFGKKHAHSIHRVGGETDLQALGPIIVGWQPAHHGCDVNVSKAMAALGAFSYLWPRLWQQSRDAIRWDHRSGYQRLHSINEAKKRCAVDLTTRAHAALPRFGFRAGSVHHPSGIGTSGSAASFMAVSSFGADAPSSANLDRRDCGIFVRSASLACAPRTRNASARVFDARECMLSSTGINAREHECVNAKTRAVVEAAAIMPNS